MLATVEAGRVVALRGDPDHPVTRGFLCHRTDRFVEERQYSPERLLEPLVRRGGRLEPASWDEALDRVAAELRDARDRLGPASILHYQSGGSLGLLKQLNRHFFELFGPVTTKRGDICSGAGDAAQVLDMGLEDAHDLDDLTNSRTIVLWGKNVAETGVHLIPHLRAARARGAEVILVDPVHHARTARLCDRYVQPRPGADRFLALAMARAMLDGGLHDPAAPSYTDGFDAFARLAHSRSLDELCALADVEPSVAVDLARAYAVNKPSALFVGWGLGRRAAGAATIRLLDALGALSGNLGIPGGGVSFYFQRRGGFDTSFVARPQNAGARTFCEPLLGEEILRASPPVAVAVIDNANPVSQLPDAKTVARALASIDCLVVLDSFLTETAELAAVVLPTATMLEQHDVVGAYGNAYVQLAQPVVAPPPGARSDLDVYRALAERLGFGDAMAAPAEAWIDRLLAPMAGSGVTRERLASGGLRKPHAPRVLFEGRVFPTPSGRFQLVTELPDVPVTPPDDFPLQLMSISTYRNQSSQIPRAVQEAAPAEVVVHPDAAGGLRDGDAARVVSPIGEAVVRVRLDSAQRRDVLIFPKGRWAKYGGPNALVRARLTDHGEGAAYYDECVRLEPVG